MHVALILAAEENSSSGAAALVQLAIFALIPIAMYFLLFRPQRKRQREMFEMQRSIEVGDEVVTNAGIYGFVTGFEGDIAWVEVDDNVQIRISRAAIARKVDTAGAGADVVDTPADDAKGSKGDAVDDEA